MKRLMTLMLLIPALGASAQVKTEISEFNLSGPYAVQAPLAFDTVDVKGNKFDDKSLMNNTSLTSPVTGNSTARCCRRSQKRRA